MKRPQPVIIGMHSYYPALEVQPLIDDAAKLRLAWALAVCDEVEVSKVIREKIKAKFKESA